MVLKDNLKHKVKIRSSKTGGELVVSTTEESFGISLEGSPDPSAPSCFFISKSSEEYLAFGNFFQKCANLNNASILIDESENIEHATILCFRSTSQGIALRFASEKNYLPEIWHFPSQKKSPLSSYYHDLYKELQQLKRQKQQEIIFEHA